MGLAGDFGGEDEAFEPDFEDALATDDVADDDD